MKHVSAIPANRPLLAVAVALAALIQTGNVVWGQQQRPDASQMQTIEHAEHLSKKIEAVFNSASATYSRALLDEIAAFYEQCSEDEQIQRSFCREWVLAVYRDMFDLNRPVQEDLEGQWINNEQRLRNHLSKNDVPYFLAQLRGYVDTAFEDLSLLQRKRLYYFVGAVSPAEDREMLDLLESYASRDELDPDERQALWGAIDKIEDSGAPAETGE